MLEEVEMSKYDLGATELPQRLKISLDFTENWPMCHSSNSLLANFYI